MKKQVSTKIGTVTPSIKGDWQFANLHECLPDYVCESLLEGMKAFGRKIKGMMQRCPFSGVETEHLPHLHERISLVISKGFSHVRRGKLCWRESLLQQWMSIKTAKPFAEDSTQN